MKRSLHNNNNMEIFIIMYRYIRLLIYYNKWISKFIKKLY